MFSMYVYIHIHIYMLLKFFCVAMTKYLDEKQLREGSVYLAYNSRLQPIKSESKDSN